MLQLGREIALSSVRRPFRRDSWTIVKPFREILATKGRAKGEDPWHFDASFFFVLFDVESRGSNFQIRRFKGFREDYSAKAIILDRFCQFFFRRNSCEEIVRFYFRKIGGI